MDGSIVQYQRLKIPMSSDRDIVYKIYFKKFDDGSTFIFIESVTHASMPEVNKVVRMQYYFSELLKPLGADGILSSTCFEHFDPKGSVWASFVNPSLSSDVPKDTKEMIEYIK